MTTNAITRKRNRVGVRFTLTPEEARAMQAYTAQNGVSMANFARTLTLREIGMSRSEKTGNEDQEV